MAKLGKKVSQNKKKNLSVNLKKKNLSVSLKKKNNSKIPVAVQSFKTPSHNNSSSLVSPSFSVSKTSKNTFLKKNDKKNADPKIKNKISNKLQKTLLTEKDKEIKKDSDTLNSLSIGESHDELKAENILPILKALLTVKNSYKSSKDKVDLFETIDGLKIHLSVSSIKLPNSNRRQLLRIVLPHRVNSKDSSSLLFVKDNKRGLKADHEDTISSTKELLDTKGVSDSHLEIMPLKVLRTEYKAYETKNALCHQYDKYLADERIIRFLPQHLGKAFIKRKIFPVPLNMSSSNLKDKLDIAQRTVMLPLNFHGSCSTLIVGTTNMSEKEIVDNILATTTLLVKRYPGGWKNIRSIHIKTEKSLALPLHISSISSNEIGFVDSDAPKRIKIENVTDELSTIPGASITIKPHGSVSLRYTETNPYPDIDEKEEEKKKKKENKSKKEEDQEEEQDKKKREKDRNVKKEIGGNGSRKRRRNSESDEDVNNKKSKKKEEEDNDSENEEIIRSEKAYLSMVSKEQENECNPTIKNDDDEKYLQESDIIQDESENETENEDDEQLILHSSLSKTTGNESLESKENKKTKVVRKKSKSERRKDVQKQKKTGGQADVYTFKKKSLKFKKKGGKK